MEWWRKLLIGSVFAGAAVVWSLACGKVDGFLLSFVESANATHKEIVQEHSFPESTELNQIELRKIAMGFCAHEDY